MPWLPVETLSPYCELNYATLTILTGNDRKHKVSGIIMLLVTPLLSFYESLVVSMWVDQLVQFKKVSIIEDSGSSAVINYRIDCH